VVVKVVLRASNGPSPAFAFLRCVQPMVSGPWVQPVVSGPWVQPMVSAPWAQNPGLNHTGILYFYGLHVLDTYINTYTVTRCPKN